MLQVVEKVYGKGRAIAHKHLERQDNKVDATLTNTSVACGVTKRRYLELDGGWWNLEWPNDSHGKKLARDHHRDRERADCSYNLVCLAVIEVKPSQRLGLKNMLQPSTFSGFMFGTTIFNVDTTCIADKQVIRARAQASRDLI